MSETLQKEGLALLWLFTIGFVARMALVALNPGLQLDYLMIAPVMTDMLAGFMIFRFGMRGAAVSPYGLPFILTLAYLLNPAVLLNFYLPDRFDSAHVFLVFVALYLLGKNLDEPVEPAHPGEPPRPIGLLLHIRRLLPFTAFGTAVFGEPAVLVVAPIFIFAAVKYINDNKFSTKSIFTMLGYVLTAAVLVLVLAAVAGMGETTARFMSAYDPVSSRGAFNFYSLTAQNFSLDHPARLTPFYEFLGAAAGTGIIVFAFWFLYKRYSAASVMLCGAFLYTTAFVFDYNMHEWFMLPALLMLLAAYVMQQKAELIRVYAGFTLAFFFNCMYVFMHGNEAFIDLPRYFIPIISFAQVVLAVYVLVLAVRFATASEGGKS